jgi:hypothetical protein
MLYSTRSISFACIVFILGCLGCSRRPGDPTGLLVERRTMDAGMTTVRTISGSVWGGTARLIEEASIGTDGNGSDDVYLLGFIEDITCDGERIYVLDANIPQVRAYDLDGRFLFDIGGPGNGPGEYTGPRRVAIHPLTGRIFIRDGTMSRINIYAPNGEYEDQWRLFSQGSLGIPMFFTPDGFLYVGAILNFGVLADEWRLGMVSWGPKGSSGDTLACPEYDFKPWRIVARSERGTNSNSVPFSPDVVWAVSRDRITISGISSEYRFEIRHPDGTMTVVENSAELVPVLPEESRWHEQARIANLRRTQPGWVWNGPPIPPHKPAYEELYPDLSGRIWILRPGPGMTHENGVRNPLEGGSFWLAPYWTDSWLLDVFAIDGRFLGPVEVPEGFRSFPSPYIKDDMVIAHIEGTDGVPRVKRYRLVLP